MGFARVIDDYMADMVNNRTLVSFLMSYVLLGEVALEQGELVLARGWCDRALKALAGCPTGCSGEGRSSSRTRWKGG